MKHHKKTRKKTPQRGYIDGGCSFFVIKEHKQQAIDYHFHTFHKCLVVFSGEVVYTVEGQAYALKRGDVLWVPSHEVHKVEVSGKAPYKRCVVYLSDEFLEMMSPGLGEVFRKRCAAKGHYFKSGSEGQKKMMANIPTTPVAMKGEARLKVMGRFITFLSDLLAGDAHKKNQAAKMDYGDKTINQAIRYIKDHQGQKMTVAEVADHCFVSSYYLMHRFKAVTGTTVHRYQMDERLTTARQLMRRGMTLTDIAYRTGFNSYSSFARAFGNTYHMSPKKFMALKPVEEDW